VCPEQHSSRKCAPSESFQAPRRLPRSPFEWTEKAYLGAAIRRLQVRVAAGQRPLPRNCRMSRAVLQSSKRKRPLPCMSIPSRKWTLELKAVDGGQSPWNFWEFVNRWRSACEALPVPTRDHKSIILTTKRPCEEGIGKRRLNSNVST
jgi:hypothetical protein